MVCARLPRPLPPPYPTPLLPTEPPPGPALPAGGIRQPGSEPALPRGSYTPHLFTGRPPTASLRSGAGWLDRRLRAFMPTYTARGERYGERERGRERREREGGRERERVGPHADLHAVGRAGPARAPAHPAHPLIYTPRPLPPFSPPPRGYGGGGGGGGGGGDDGGGCGGDDGGGGGGGVRRQQRWRRGWRRRG